MAASLGRKQGGLFGSAAADRSSAGCVHLQERIGAGGMGEVYRARDTKLGRDVAIKVLPPAFALIAIDSVGSSERRESSLRSIIPTSRRFTGSRKRATSAAWCWSWWKGRRWPNGWLPARSRLPKR